MKTLSGVLRGFEWKCFPIAGCPRNCLHFGYTQESHTAREINSRLGIKFHRIVETFRRCVRKKMRNRTLDWWLDGSAIENLSCVQTAMRLDTWEARLGVRRLVSYLTTPRTLMNRLSTAVNQSRNSFEKPSSIIAVALVISNVCQSSW